MECVFESRFVCKLHQFIEELLGRKISKFSVRLEQREDEGQAQKAPDAQRGAQLAKQAPRPRVTAPPLAHHWSCSVDPRLSYPW